MIRPAIVDDFSDIKKIANQNRGFISFIMRQSLIDAIEQNALNVIEINNQVVAFVRFYRRKDGWNTLHEIAVKKEHQHQGYGQVLFDSVPYPKRLKTTEDNEFAINFYRKNNMEQVKIEEGKKRRLIVFEKEHCVS